MYNFLGGLCMKKGLIYLKGYYKEAVLAPLFKMLEALFELMVPLAVKQIIDVGMVGGDTKTIFLMCGVMILLGVVGLASALCAIFFCQGRRRLLRENEKRPVCTHSELQLFQNR